MSHRKLSFFFNSTEKKKFLIIAANEVDDKCKTAVSFYQCIGLLPQN